MSPQRWFVSALTVLLTATIIMGSRGVLRNDLVQNLLQFATFIVLAATLLVLFGYARDTETIAKASLQQVETARADKDRAERNAMARASVALVEYALVGERTATVAERDAAEWRLRREITRETFSIDGSRYIELCAKIEIFLNGKDTNAASRKQRAAELAGDAAAIANAPLMKEYWRQLDGMGSKS